MAIRKSFNFATVWIVFVIYFQHNCLAQYDDYYNTDNPCVYDEGLFLYEALGCDTKEEVINGTVCKIPTNCSNVCLDDQGQPHLQDSKPWYEWEDLPSRTRRKCECLSPHYVLWFTPWIRDGGAIPYPPYRYCRLVGCERWDIDWTVDPPTERTMYSQPGEEYEKEDGKLCKCVKGADPWMADMITLYYYKCKYPKCLYKSNPWCPVENKVAHTKDGAPSCCGCKRMFIDPRTKEPAFPSDLLADGYCTDESCIKSGFNCTDNYGRVIPDTGNSIDRPPLSF